MNTREKEIRKLTSIQLYELAQILDLNDSWKKLMRIIPKNPFSDSPEDAKIYKYSLDHERLIENASKNQHRMAAEILFEEWGTSGKVRPTLGVLLELLTRAHLFRAADLVAIKYLNEPPPPRPAQGPAARIDISIPLDSEFVQDVENMLENGSLPGTDTLNDNANSSKVADNNIDYYEKYTPNAKRLSILTDSNRLHDQNPSTSNNDTEKGPPNAHTDLIKFSLTSETAPQDNIPMLSELNLQSSDQSKSSNSSTTYVADDLSTTSMDLPNLSALQQQPTPQPNGIDKLRPITSKEQAANILELTSTSISTSQDIPMLSALHQSTSNQQQSSSMDLPNLSALNTHSSLGDIIPNLSTLNVHDTSPPPEDKMNSKFLREKCPSRQSFSSGESTISSSSDDDDISAPNLSLLDQRSSNNDSSLTNVTATSEENSFEMSLNEGGSTSYDNIPCLSVLK